MRSRKTIIALLILNILMAVIITNLLINREIKIEKQLIKEMTEGEYESKLTELNTSHEDYALQVQANKQKLATAISNQKVATSEDATIDEMVTNIGKILQVGTSDATATADNIAEGKTAYVNGELVVGNGADILAASNTDKTDILWQNPTVGEPVTTLSINCNWEKYDYIAIIYCKGYSILTSDQVIKICNVKSGERQFSISNLHVSNLRFSI